MDFFEKNNYLLYLIGTDGSVRAVRDVDAKTSYNIIAIPKEKETQVKHT